MEVVTRWVQHILPAWIYLSVSIENASSFNLDVATPTILRASAPSDGSYFGFSLGFHTENNKHWLYVGAPRANSTTGMTTATSTGSIYKCSIDNNTQLSTACTQLNIGLESKPTDGCLEKSCDYFTRKDGQWLGGSLDSRTTANRQQKIVVCGHKLKHAYSNLHELDNRKQWYAPGVCWALTSTSDDAIKISPLVNTDTQILDSVPSGNKYHLGFALFGMSVHITAEGNIVMGAPGIWQWSGGVVVQIDRTTCIIEPYSKTKQLVNEDSYFGYSVTSTKTTAGSPNTTYIAGAPRSNSTGEVIVFQIDDITTCKWSHSQRFTGDQFCSYYGSSVSVADVNGDGLEDLLVGAPSYNQSIGDEGAVFVYLNLGTSKFAEDGVKLTGGGKTGSLFGTAMTSLGDANMDEYMDIVIGAPGEDKGQGAVYMYLGSRSGVPDKFAQRIAASQIDSSFRLFGSTFTSVLDVDGNDYKDVGVGVYGSESAVILRTRPVHTVVASISFSKPVIYWNNPTCVDPSDKSHFICIDVILTFRYIVPKEESASGRNRQNHLQGLEYELIMDSTRSGSGGQKPRGHLGSKSPSPTNTVRKELVFTTADKPEIVIWQATFKKGERDIQTPVEFKVNLLWNDKSTPTRSKTNIQYNVLTPVFNQLSKSTAQKSIDYAKDCGSDGVCTPELKIVLRPKKKKVPTATLR